MATIRRHSLPLFTGGHVVMVPQVEVQTADEPLMGQRDFRIIRPGKSHDRGSAAHGWSRRKQEQRVKELIADCNKAFQALAPEAQLAARVATAAHHRMQ